MMSNKRLLHNFHQMALDPGVLQNFRSGGVSFATVHKAVRAIRSAEAADAFYAGVARGTGEKVGEGRSDLDISFQWVALWSWTSFDPAILPYFRAVNVAPDSAKRLDENWGGAAPFRRMAEAGVDPEYVRQLWLAGLTDLTHTVQAWRAGAPAEYVASA